MVSPDGKLEFRIFVGQPAGSGLTRLGYEVFYRGKRVVATSWLGLDIVMQEPLLGENLGLMESSSGQGPGYNELRARYMQNGSLGRMLNVEARAYDDKVEFRYVLPVSTPLATPFTIDDEKTEFAVEPGAAGKVKFSEERGGAYPGMILLPETGSVPGSVLVTRLAAQYEAKAPLATPWRVISVRE